MSSKVYIYEQGNKCQKSLSDQTEPMRKLMTIGWAGVTKAINKLIVDENVFDQSAALNVLNILCMVVNARAFSHDLWQEHFKVRVLDAVLTLFHVHLFNLSLYIFFDAGSQLFIAIESNCFAFGP